MLDQIRGKVALIRHITPFRPGDINMPLASAKAAMRALARRWLWLHEEIIAHDKELERLVTERAPDLIMSHGIATLTGAEMLILVGDNPTRIRFEAAFAKLCSVCAIPASSDKTHRFRLNRAVTGRPTLPFTASLLSGYETTNQLLLTSNNVRKMGREKGSSNVTSSDTSTASYASIK
ncbi:hypothetical protein [Sulfitobacter sp. NAS-14.1]|uniref:hypothetical protein n=1 Tax=Sulfitobacter sp. (strain NAS-14.1) TaxID=314267 RepID=UPI000322EBF2|nr:hypothetical protein [Sulfitobacter sp. NAS-14.1]